MTAMQQEARAERLAIMIIDGGCSEAEAIEYCNRHSSIYGLVELVESQGGLW